mgnify:CR=1 FL=1
MKSLTYYQKALALKDEAWFFKNGKPRKYIVHSKMVRAKYYIDKAYELTPICESIMFLMGQIYRYFDDTHIAIACYRNILVNKRFNDEDVNCRSFPRDVRDAIQNDAHFQLYRIYYDLGKHKRSQQHLRWYLNGLKNGSWSLFVPLEKFIIERGHLL